MKERRDRLKISTPGRVCLFGEHQDYLLLPVIPCAISLRISLEGRRREDQTVLIDLPDTGERESFSFSGPLTYNKERDYFRSAVNVLRRLGFTFSSGFDCVVRGDIPINAGTSSSSALVVTWVNFLTQMSDQAVHLPPMDVARIAHETEVLEFGEPGGMMDHFSTAMGGVIAIDFSPSLDVVTLDADLGTFVLGDSGEPKDTKGILARVKDQVVEVTRRLAERHPGFTLQTQTVDGLAAIRSELTADQQALLAGTVRNRDLTAEAKALLLRKPLDHRRMGELLNAHQAVLRDVLRISTPKIDRMIDAAMEGGAYGGKINGSGGGGCMFAYAPEDPGRVAAAIEATGGRALVVRPDGGTANEKFATEE